MIRTHRAPTRQATLSRFDQVCLAYAAVTVVLCAFQAGAWVARYAQNPPGAAQQHRQQSQLPTSEEFDALVLGKSADELRALLGDPEAVEPCLAPQRTFDSGAAYEDRLQAMAAGASDPGHSRWTYRGVTRHPKTGQPGGVVFVTVGFDQVIDVLYADGY
jgi:hypothetical protein